MLAVPGAKDMFSRPACTYVSNTYGPFFHRNINSPGTSSITKPCDCDHTLRY